MKPKRYLVIQSWNSNFQSFYREFVAKTGAKKISLVSTFPGHVDDPQMHEIMLKRQREYFPGSEMIVHDAHTPMQQLLNMEPCDLLIIDSLNMLLSNWMLRAQATNMQSASDVWAHIDPELNPLTGRFEEAITLPGIKPKRDPFEGRVKNILILYSTIVQYPPARTDQGEVYTELLNKLISDFRFEHIPVIIPFGKSFMLSKAEDYPLSYEAIDV